MQDNAVWHPDRFSKYLRTLRKHLDVTQATLAQWAGVSAPQISRWNSGTSRPGYDSLRQLLAAAIAQAPDDTTVKRLAETIGEAAGYPQMPLALNYTTTEMVSPYSGRVWKIVTSLEKRAQAADLDPEVERALIERAMRNAEQQAELMFDAELRRYEQGETEE